MLTHLIAVKHTLREDALAMLVLPQVPAIYDQENVWQVLPCLHQKISPIIPEY